MGKISTLPAYDQSTANVLDFFPIVQAGVTKKLTIEAMAEARKTYSGFLSNTPMASELVTILGTPTISASFMVKRTNASMEVFLCVYDKPDDEWWTQKLKLAP